MFISYAIYKNWPDQQTHLIFCDVGQGDAILITRGFWQMLIDGGPDDKILSCLNKYVPFWDRNLEVIVTTHADQDHIGGLIFVLKQYQVNTLFLSDVNNTQTFDEFRILLLKQLDRGLVVKKPFLGQLISPNSKLQAKVMVPNLNLNDHKFLFSNINSETVLSDYFAFLEGISVGHNQRSIVLFLEIEKARILLTGDLEHTGEQALIDYGMTDKIDVLKAGHHGAKTSSLNKFIEELRPEICVISCAKFNRFNHPNGEVLKSLEQIGSKILRTDQHGNIEFIFADQYYYLAD